MPPRLCATNTIGRSIVCIPSANFQASVHRRTYVRELSLPTQVGHEGQCMVVEVFAADARAGMGVCIVTPAQDAGLGDVMRQEIAEPVDAVTRGPRRFAVAVEPVNGDDAARKQLAMQRR